MDRLRTIFDGMFDGVWLIGSDGRTTYANDAMAGLLGMTPAEMQGRPITEFLADEFKPVAEAMIGRQRRSPGERVDMRFLRADGADLWTLVAASPIMTAEGSFVGSMLNVSDVTGKRAAQNQAMQNQKLEAIGAFAAGISHDFNNLLTSIRGYAELAHAELPDDSPIRADLDQVINSADRARAITAKLLAFTRGQALQPVVVDPGRVILDVLPVLRPLLAEDIEVILDVTPARTWIRMDPVALEQVIVNLATNAHDAMLEGGTLTISMDELEGHPGDSLGGAARAPSVRIRLRDTGAGMEQATLDHLFDPFFTTKEVGKGTGLGLSTVYGLIRQSGGTINAETTIGQGSTFTIILPKVGVPFERQSEPPVVQAPDLGVGVVLMVEDEPSIREFARRVLDRAGHTLLTAGNGAEALQIVASWQGSIDVLLTDIVMPGMHGQALAAKVQKLRPDVRVVFMSGYAEDAIPPLERPSAFLAKPFSAATLDQAVAREIAMARVLREQ